MIIFFFHPANHCSLIFYQSVIGSSRAAESHGALSILAFDANNQKSYRHRASCILRRELLLSDDLLSLPNVCCTVTSGFDVVQNLFGQRWCH